MNCRSLRSFLSAALFAGLWCGTAAAISANPNLVIAQQPDGTKISLRIYGDERSNWQSDINGFAVQRRDDGNYVYAAHAGARAAAGDLIVGKSDPIAAGLKRGAPPTAVARGASHSAERSAAPAGAEPLKRISPVGAVKNVVILMKFPNHATRTLPTVANINTLFNNVGPDPVMAPSGSVRDVYLANSYGTFQLNSTVFAWVTLPKTEQYYANGTSGGDAKMFEAIKDALVLADPLINFKDFDKDGDGFVDAIAFLHSGYGAEWGGTDSDGTDFKNRIWSHRWSIPTWTSAEAVKVSAYHISPALWSTSGSAPGRIGVICHETGHFFGLPDLYDGGAGEGIGSWCMMANSWGFDGQQYHPPHFSAWSKIFLKWVNPTVISAPGTYTAPASANSATVFKITAGYPAGEYLLIENRQPVQFDSQIPAGTGGKGGLAIWHIDDPKGTNTDGGFPGQAGYPTNGKHYMVSLLQADGKYDMEKGVNRGDGDDVYRAGWKTDLNHTTVPNADAYQGGAVADSKNLISEISASAASMTFKYGDVITPPATGTKKMGYAWANLPTSASYSPSAAYAYNSSGGAITVTRSAKGTYAVKFAGLGGGTAFGGHVQVTPYGSGSEMAKVTSWSSSGADFIANIKCFTAAGAAADTQFNVLVLWP